MPEVERDVVVSGPAYLLFGVRLWRTHPRLMALAMVPALVVLLVLLACFVVLALTVGDLVAWTTPFADRWSEGLRSVARLLLAIAVLVGAVVLASVVFTGLTLAVGDPFYERVWRATEAMLGDAPTGGGLGPWRSVRDAGALMGVALLAALAVGVLGFLPLVGTGLGLVGGIALSGRLLAAELLARPLEARGLDRRARGALVRRRRVAVWGFGITTQACFLVPLGAVAVMPAAVAGATYLARDLLASDQPAATGDTV